MESEQWLKASKAHCGIKSLCNPERLIPHFNPMFLLMGRTFVIGEDGSGSQTEAEVWVDKHNLIRA